MHYPKLKLTANILFRVFWLGFAFLILAWLWFILGHQFWYQYLLAPWHLGSPEFIDTITLLFFAMAKFVLFFYVLIPAIAIRWTVCKLEKQAKS